MTARDRLYAHVVEQFRRPHGALGHVAGWILAHRPSNRRRNDWTVDLLEIRPEDRVLELGFGPGLAIAACATRASRGLVVGIDHSPTMTRAAARRNARAIASGRVVLHTAPFEELARLDTDGTYDAILAVNAVTFAHDPDAVLAQCVTRLRPGGRIALTFQSRQRGASDADSRHGAEALAASLDRAGLADVRTEVLPLSPAAAVCVIGRRAG
jgi:SAM-dependent methyltransferase